MTSGNRMTLKMKEEERDNYIHDFIQGGIDFRKKQITGHCNFVKREIDGNEMFFAIISKLIL